jgi:uncharacterized repeat protein (TIGR01451 family)/LPXTG-motif cell wall-anchored protein
MSNLISLINRAPKRFTATLAILAAAIIVPVAAYAWGPDRQTYTYENPAPHVTFNSITNNPRVGDERNFVRIREDVAGATFGDNVNLQAGKTYEVMVYYHNNAASNLNASGKGIAHNVNLKMDMPAVIKPGVNAALTGTISSPDAQPTSVWDEAWAKNGTNADMAFRYITGSAKISSNGAVNGTSMPDSMFTTGAPLGYDSLNGTVPGCNEYAGYVFFKVRTDQPNFTIKKQVSVDGKTWVDDSVKANPGATIQYRIVYENTGTSQQNNVSLRDTLPAGVTYVSGSSFIANETTGGQYKPNTDGITTTGVNVGSYKPSGNVYYKFSAKLPTEDKLKCGTNTLVNTALASTTGGSKTDTATVTVDRECKPVVKYTCDALGVTVVDRTHFTFNTKYTVQNATFKSVTYVIKDANGKVVDTKTSKSTSLNYTQTTTGKYTVQATITVTVDGTDKTATSSACKASFEVPAQPGNITVCELSTKKIVTINENQFDASKYSKDLSKCQETPVTPPELPQTGMTENIVAITGLGALIASIVYYVASRRALNQ